jgi:hypothetical protein
MRQISVPAGIPSQLGYWLILLTVGAAMTVSIASLLASELGWVLGSVLGLLLAIAIEWLFATSLLTWRRERRIGLLLLVCLFGMISVFADAPLIFRIMRGHALTTAGFEEQRSAATRDIIIAREQLASAAAAATRLADYSRLRADEEARIGNTCEKSNGKPGPRSRFRQAEAESFKATAEAIAASSQRLDGAVAAVQALKPEVGEALRAALQRLDGGIATAFSIVRDPALAALAANFDKRTQEDADERRDPKTGETFHCPDPTIRDSAKSIAQQLRSLPELKQRPQVVDFTDPNAVIVELPVRLMATIVAGPGRPGTLTGIDIAALIAAVVFEMALVGAVMLKPVDPAIGRRVRAARGAFACLTDAELGGFLHLLGEPDVRIGQLFSLIDRYRMRMWPFDLVVVAHGTSNADLNRMGHVLPVLSALGWARRYYLIPGTVVALTAWRRWPEMRGCCFREVFRIKLTAFDELRLAELCSRMHRRGETGPTIDLAAVPIAAE